MALTVPAELLPILEAADRSPGPIDEYSLPGRLMGSIAPGRELSSEERKGAMAEIDAWRFQRSRLTIDGPGKSTGRNSRAGAPRMERRFTRRTSLKSTAK